MFTRRDLDSATNLLLLNPRRPKDERYRFENAWYELVEGRFESMIGIATSGSTGDSGSLVLLSKSALKASARAVNERLLARKEDVWFKTLPDFHVGGLGIHVRALLAGFEVVEDESDKWDANAFHQSLIDSRSTLLSLVPTQLFDLVHLGLSSPRSLRAVVIGGGRLEESLRVRALALGWPVLPSYGMTEASSQVATALSPEDPRLVPLSHVSLDVDREGRLQVSGASLLSAKMTFGTEGAALVDPKKQGWYTTEDRGEILADGSIVVHGRSHDFVKIGGEGVTVSRLEAKLLTLKLEMGISKEVVLLAAKDERLGAKIVLLTNANASDVERLREAFDSSVAPYERIRSVFPVTEIPKTELGKVQRAKALAAVGLESASDV